jgi:hypothetical protein
MWVGLEEWIIGDDAMEVGRGGSLRAVTVCGYATSIAVSTATDDGLVDRSVPDPVGFRPQAELVGTVIWSRGQRLVIQIGDQPIAVSTTDHVTRKIGSRIRADVAFWVEAPYESMMSKGPRLRRDWIVDRLMVEDGPNPGPQSGAGRSTTSVEIERLPAEFPRPVDAHRLYFLDLRPTTD